MIIAPTRELAQQIGKALFRFTKFCDDKIFVEVAAGGGKMEEQVKRLSRPTQILVATPGRLIDLLEYGLLLDGVKYLILDEADEMLSMGFQEELGSICQATKGRSATWLFSATFQTLRFKKLVETYMSPQCPSHSDRSETSRESNIDHRYTICDRADKDAWIADYLRSQGDQRGLIFCRTRAGSIRMGQELEKEGLSVAVIQGDLSQKDREKIMRAFRKERVQFLIATDVAARGIDVEGLSFVIHHQFA